jgi:adenylate cyclase
MAIEIERKFLVADESWRTAVSRTRRIRQGYLSNNGVSSVRVRCAGDDRAFLTIKSAEQGARRQEFEYTIPVADAEALLALCEGNIVEKLRHDVLHGGLTWEVDEFLGANQGLVIAEVELARVDQVIDRPAWLGSEVTSEQRYYNAGLARRPFNSW